MYGLKSADQYFVLNAETDRKPMKFLQDWGNVVHGRSPCNDAGSRVLEKL